MKTTDQTTPITPYLMPAIVILGSFLFSSKGILVKMMYAEGLDPSAVLALRMSVALPFYLTSAILMRRSLRKISAKDWLAISGLALIGYFLCSLVNFIGLQFISVGLERVVLFCYPSLVLLGSAVFQKRRPSLTLISACGLSWVGLYLVIQHEIQITDHTTQILLGSALVLLSAIIYASYILIAKQLIMRVGSQRYTSVVMCFSCLVVLLYFGITDGNIPSLLASKKAMTYGVIIGIFGTVVPTYILSFGLSKISADSYAVLSSAGPVATIALSLAIVGQIPSGMQCAGITLSVAGCLLASRRQ
ncbi:hypothetical protein NT6N_09550 [Oceaniferula spumae]|uniref:EamA domain-containing protein n=1 Tax=Oceaniferula spumae TaxID=2979115 RepID=A0AAT9FIU7_9BACT